jgi:hypothetical protein
MSEQIGDRVESHAIAEYKTLCVTGVINWLMPRQFVFVAGYMKGYMRAQDDYIAKLKDGMAQKGYPID